MSLSTADRDGAWMVGATLFGGKPSAGFARVVRTASEPFGGAAVMVETSTDVPASVSVVLSVNGESVVRTGVSEGTALQAFTLTTLEAGTHTVRAQLHRERFVTVEEFAGTESGGETVFLRWTRSTSADVAAYRIEWDQADSDWTTLADVSEIRPDHVSAALPDSGTGTGRLTSDGAWTGDATNAKWRVKIAASTSQFQVDPGSGTFGAARDIIRDAPNPIGDGLSVTFDSASSSYLTGDTWEIWVGPRTRYITAPLASGTHQFRVSALDDAGNQSAATSAVSVVVDPDPAPPSSLAVSSYNASTRVFTLAATGADGGSTYKLFSNYDVTTNTLSQSVIYDYPVATRSGPGALTLTCTTGNPEGAYLFVCRREVSGRNSRNFDAVEYLLPAGENTIAVPANVQAFPAAEGRIRVTYSQDIAPPLATPTSIGYRVSDAGGSTVQTGVLSFSAGSSIGVVNGSGTITGLSPFTDGATYYVSLRAAGSGSLLTSYSPASAVVIDSTAPSAPSGLFAGGA